MRLCARSGHENRKVDPSLPLGMTKGYRIGMTKGYRIGMTKGGYRSG